MTLATSRKIRYVLIVSGAMLALALLYLYWVQIAVWFASAQLGRSSNQAPSLGLAGYTATIQARPIEGLSRNTSGLTYNSATNTLFAVINRPASVAELSLDGRLLRHMPLPGAGDAEGITHVIGDWFLIVDESDQRLHRVRIRPGDKKARVEPAIELALDFDAWHNLGLEGISWDAQRSELLLANEMWPQRILWVQGLQPDAAGGQPRMQSWQPAQGAGLLGRDLASVSSHDASGNLLLLSETSALITEYTRDGNLVGILPLWAGRAGLHETVPQPEGMTVAPDGTIYMVSEPNLFYRFEHQGGASRPVQ